MIGNFVLVLTYLGTSGLGLFKMKSANAMFTPSFAIGCAFYALGFVLWIVILRRLPLSVAFPIAAGGLIVVTQLIGLLVLGEASSSLHFAGVALTLGGIVLMFHAVSTT